MYCQQPEQRFRHTSKWFVFRVLLFLSFYGCSTSLFSLLSQSFGHGVKQQLSKTPRAVHKQMKTLRYLIWRMFDSYSLSGSNLWQDGELNMTPLFLSVHVLHVPLHRYGKKLGLRFKVIVLYPRVHHYIKHELKVTNRVHYIFLLKLKVGESGRILENRL